MAHQIDRASRAGDARDNDTSNGRARTGGRSRLNLTPRGSAVARAAVVTLIFLAVIGIQFRPGLRSIFHQVPANLGDPALIIWILAWGGHAALHQPLDYFDANIFWPNDSTLAYAENMAPLVPLFNAVYQPSDNWALGLNVLALSLVLLNLWATFALARWFTQRTDVAVVAAVAFAVNGYVVGRWGHIQLQALGFLPLCFLLFFRLLERRRLATAFALGVSSAALILSALYYGAIYAVAIAAMLGVYLLAKRFRPGPGLVRGLAVTAVTMAIIVLPFIVPYVRAQDRPNLRRAMEPTGGLNLSDVFTPARGSYLYPRLDRLTPTSDVEHRFFPGFATMALAVAGAVGLVMASKRLRRDDGVDRLDSVDGVDGIDGVDPVELTAQDGAPEGVGPPVPADRALYGWLMVTAAAAAVVLAIGPTFAGRAAPYRFFYHHVPGFASTRITARFAVVAMLTGAILAALGLAWITRRLSRAAQYGVAAVVVVVLLAEFAAPIPNATLPTSRAQLAVYHELTRRPKGAVVELPMHDPRVNPAAWAYVEAPRLVYSTLDFKPRLNGYSGGLPPAYLEDIDAVTTFPQPAALDRLRLRQVRFVVIHIGTENGYPAFTEADAAAMVAGLPVTARADRYGSAYLVDLASG